MTIYRRCQVVSRAMWKPMTFQGWTKLVAPNSISNEWGVSIIDENRKRFRFWIPFSDIIDFKVLEGEFHGDPNCM
jgi:hypothetical protein